jgi:hypothetical protein
MQFSCPRKEATPLAGRLVHLVKNVGFISQYFKREESKITLYTEKRESTPNI